MEKIRSCGLLFFSSTYICVYMRVCVYTYIYICMYKHFMPCLTCICTVRYPRRLTSCLYRSADKSLARPGRKQTNVSVRMTWISFGALPCRKRNLMTARVSMLLKSRASLTCFRACFLPGRAKDLSAPQYAHCLCASYVSVAMFTCIVLASVPIDGCRTVGRNLARALTL